MKTINTVNGLERKLFIVSLKFVGFIFGVDELVGGPRKTLRCYWSLNFPRNIRNIIRIKAEIISKFKNRIMVIYIKYALNKNIHIMKKLLNSLDDLMADLPLGKKFIQPYLELKKRKLLN